jgi:hypothetical protein
LLQGLHAKDTQRQTTGDEQKETDQEDDSVTALASEFFSNLESQENEKYHNAAEASQPNGSIVDHQQEVRQQNQGKYAGHLHPHKGPRETAAAEFGRHSPAFVFCLILLSFLEIAK